MTYYQFGYETVATRKTGIPARFATLSREAWERQMGEKPVAMIIDEGKSYTFESGSTFYLHSTFEETA